MLLEEKINYLKKEIISYGELIENMIDKVFKCLSTSDINLIKEVIEKDEPKSNNFEIEFDETCTHLIAQFSPKGKDLRTILMILKMSNDLERIGDHIVNIAQSIIFLIEKPKIKILDMVIKISEQVKTILKNSIDSFIYENSQLAKNVCEHDSEVDIARDEIFKELKSCMKDEPSSIDQCLHMMRITSNLERIADISTNICEDVIYIVEGKIIKHHFEEKIT